MTCKFVLCVIHAHTHSNKFNLFSSLLEHNSIGFMEHWKRTHHQRVISYINGARMHIAQNLCACIQDAKCWTTQIVYLNTNGKYKIMHVSSKIKLTSFTAPIVQQLT